MTFDDRSCSASLYPGRLHSEAVPSGAEGSDLFLVGADRPVSTARSLISPQERRAWFLGGAPAPAAEPAGQAGRAAMAAELDGLPFLLWVRALLGFVGEGCRLTKQGRMFATDRRQIEALCSDGAESFRRAPYGTSSRFDLAWATLLADGLLVREEGWVRPSGAPLPVTTEELCSEAGLEQLRTLLAAALESVGAARTVFWTPLEVTADVLDAVLVASGSEGLMLPEELSADGVVHCAESQHVLLELLRHPHIREVPRDPHSGHVARAAVERLARTADTLDHLVDCGLLRREDIEVEVRRTDEHCGGADRSDGPGAIDDYYDLGEPRTSRKQIIRAPQLLRGAVAQVCARRDASGTGRAAR